MEEQAADAREVLGVAAASERVDEAKKDVKEAEDKLAAAEAKVNAAREAIKEAGSNQKEWEDELQYAKEVRQEAFEVLKSLQETRNVREKLLNNLLLRQSGVMQSVFLFELLSACVTHLAQPECLEVTWIFAV
jgi:chromosome segregation ATPase